MLSGSSTWRFLLTFALLLIGAQWVTAALGPPPAATQPAGGEALTERQQSLLLQLADAEANIKALNVALVRTGYKVGLAYERIDSELKGNELMDRNGGGPVRWDAFYGKTARSFYVPQSEGTLHAESPGKRVDIHVAEGYHPIQRPRQLDYIYKANNDQIAKAQTQVAALAQDQATLLARRQKHEADQSRLWATLAWEQVRDREIDLHPVCRFALKPAGAQAAVLGPVILFLRTVDRVAADGLDAVQSDQGSTFQSGVQRMDAGFALLQHSLADALDSGNLGPREQKTGKALKARCKELAEECKIIAENYANAMDREQAKQDASKLEFRAQLQASLSRFAASAGQLDDDVIITVKAWGLDADKATPAKDAVIAAPPVGRKEQAGARTAAPLVPAAPASIKERPIIPSPQGLAIDSSDWRVWCWSAKRKRWSEYPLNKMTIQSETEVLRVKNTADHSWKRSILLYRGAVLEGDFDISVEFRGPIESFDLQAATGDNMYVDAIVTPDAENRWHTARLRRSRQEVAASIDDVPVKLEFGPNSNGLIKGYFCLKLHPNDVVEVRNVKLQQAR
jgi:hypothetical protein